MRHNRTRAHEVIDSEIPGGLDVFFDDLYVARGDVVNKSSNEPVDSSGAALSGDIFTETGDVSTSGGLFGFIASSEMPGEQPSVTLNFDVENRGSTDGGGVLGSGNPDSCQDGDGTAIRVVYEVAATDGSGFAADSPLVGTQIEAEACIPDNGIIGSPVKGDYRLEIPSGWVGATQVGDTITFDVWAEGANSGTRVTPIYRIEGVGLEPAEDTGGGDSGGDNGDETDDGGGSETTPAFGDSFTVTNREWREEGDEIVVDVTIEGGDGGAQSIPVSYYIDGTEFDSGTIAGQGVAEGNTESDEGDIDLAEIEPGDHLLEVEVGGAGVLEVDTITVEEQPSGDPAEQLSIENCDAGQFGSGAAVSADIANTSQFPITTDVQVLVDRQVEATIEAGTISGGQSQPISQQVPLPDSPGDYQVSITTTNSSYK